MTAFGLYVHIPFCLQRCPYCAFAVVVGRQDLYERYAVAVCAELRQWAHLRRAGPLQTVYFGGGTPSVVEPSQLEAILATAEKTFGFAPEAEITLEANPATADMQTFNQLRQVGFNRLSLGVQSFNEQDLKTLGRRHTAAEAKRAFREARRAGFDNVNLDLMCSIPGAPREHWTATIDTILALHPEHISAYALTIEEGARFAQQVQRGALQPVSEEDDAWAYECTMETLCRAGYEHYEVSNFARPGFRSRHNWGYWHGASYLGVGLSAHSFVHGRRCWNTSDIGTYLTAVESGKSPCAGQETIDAVTARRECLWLQLRTSQGVLLRPAEARVLQVSATFEGMRDQGLVNMDGLRLRLSPRGFLLADAIGVVVVDLLETMQSG